MQNAATILEIIRERGRRGLPLERVYRVLFNEELYLAAYGRIYRNKGAMTPGTTPETVDGMSMEKIQNLIEDVRHERHRWRPVRRVHIPKSNGKTRPLGIPTWTDKLLQEVIRMILEAYYEPQMSHHSHGFRPDRGCHTALAEISDHWTGTVWFIEGDIKGCFDNINHTILLSILREKIHDNRFVRLIENLLQAGYLEEWKYNATYSGTPQGGIVSPLLANIYLDRLDKHIEQTLLPAHNRGNRRKTNLEYQKHRWKIKKAWIRGDREEARKLRQELRQLPSVLLDDPDYRRLRYIRYADDFLLGFTGPRSEAEEIKAHLRTFLESLNLELSEEKTLITHGKTEKARFLGYDIGVFQQDNCLEDTYWLRRNLNGKINLKVPPDVLRNKCAGYLQDDKPIHRMALTHNTEYSIVEQYQNEYRGVVQYYQMAHNLHKLNRLKWVMEQSLVKTLANKLKISVPKVYDRFKTIIRNNEGNFKGLRVTVEREGKTPLVATWGGIPLRRKKRIILNDQTSRPKSANRSEILDRLLAEECELCGSQENIQVHHIRGLKDLNKPGQKERPQWVRIMAARKRKTLIVCQDCHRSRIHPGRYDGTRT